MKNKNDVRIVPKRVLINLEKVHDSGMVNMFDLHGVYMELSIIDKWSGIWLDKYLQRTNTSWRYDTTKYVNILIQFLEHLRGKNEIRTS